MSQAEAEIFLMAVIDLISDKAKLVAFKCERKFAMRACAGQNYCVKPDWNKLQTLALEEIEGTLAELPLPLREQAQKLPVTFEPAPNAGLQADGIEPDTLGIFTGAEFADEGATVLPSQIIVFLGNLWDFAENDEKIFREEIRKTFLHELGHFFGLDEKDLTERGLE